MLSFFLSFNKYTNFFIIKIDGFASEEIGNLYLNTIAVIKLIK